MSNVNVASNVRAGSEVGVASPAAVGDSWTPVRRSEESPRARALLLTVLGEFVLPDGGAAWTGTIVEAMAVLGVEEAASRQALARSSSSGLLQPERIGRRTRWSLTERARRLLTDGAARIYGFGSGGPSWDGRWLLVLTTVPEHNRHLRSRLRSRMTWIGLGQLGPGTWVSPWAEREDDARAILAELDLLAGALSWVGRPGVLGGVEDRVGEIWDLATLASEYEQFRSAAGMERPASDKAAFGSLVRLVHDWRHFPGADPGLPGQLLPSGWPAPAAAELFRDRRAEWSPAAWSYWRSLTEA